LWEYYAGDLEKNLESLRERVHIMCVVLGLPPNAQIARNAAPIQSP
jgi:hypothetical protein